MYFPKMWSYTCRRQKHQILENHYAGLPEEEDDFDFGERFAALKAEFAAQLEEEAQLNKRILRNLENIEYEKSN
jgi:hypothetical protein